VDVGVAIDFSQKDGHASRRRQLRLGGLRSLGRPRHRTGRADGTPPRGDRARRPRGAALVRHRGAPPPRVLRLGTAGDPGGRGGAHVPDPPGQRGGRAQRHRPGPAVPAVRHGRPDLQGACRPGGGPGLVHRGLSAVRAEPRRLRLAVRGEARPPAAHPGLRARHVVGPAPAGTDRAGRLPAADAGPAADLGGGRGDAGVLRAGRPARAAAHGGDHRWGAPPVRPAGRPVPPGRGAGRAPARAVAGGAARVRLRRREHAGRLGHHLPGVARDVHEGLPRAGVRPAVAGAVRRDERAERRLRHGRPGHRGGQAGPDLRAARRRRPDRAADDQPAPGARRPAAVSNCSVPRSRPGWPARRDRRAVTRRTAG
jgi:hypothetical protein